MQIAIVLCRNFKNIAFVLCENAKETQRLLERLANGWAGRANGSECSLSCACQISPQNCYFVVCECAKQSSSVETAGRPSLSIFHNRNGRAEELQC